MDKSIDNFSVASDNWDQMGTVRDLKAHLESLALWYQADSEPDVVVLQAVDTCKEALDNLFQVLIDLQLKLVSAL